jgi:signal transduction histidine kinase
MLDQLLENAVKFSPKGGQVTVTLRPIVQASPDAVVGDAPHICQKHVPDKASAPCTILELCITDDGQGIPAEHLERIFERFHRVDTRLTRETGGLGLGLTICRRIVELHGGAIWAESEPSERGSAFYVQLMIDGTADLV